jgi:hypothetical protein
MANDRWWIQEYNRLSLDEAPLEAQRADAVKRRNALKASLYDRLSGPVLPAEEKMRLSAELAKAENEVIALSQKLTEMSKEKLDLLHRIVRGPSSE